MIAKWSVVCVQWSLLLVLVTALAACGPMGGNSATQKDELEKAAVRIYAEVPDSAKSAELVERGQKFFRQAGCESCHSTRLDRMGLMGPPLGGVSQRVLDRHSNDQLEGRRWLVKHIKSPELYPSPFTEEQEYEGMQMPAYAKFNDEDMRALVEFLWTLR